YHQNVFVYNSYLTNWGSWYCRIPGWQGPKACGLAESPTWAGVWYTYGILGGGIFGCFLMRKAKERWPHIGTMGLIGISLVAWMIADLFMELTYLRQGFYAYAGAQKGFTLFYGHYYQFPLVEMLGWGSC